MYGKWFASAYTGSMAGAGADIFAVWGYVVAHAGYGYVDLNPAVVGSLIGMPTDNVNKSIDYLCQPDPASRNQDQDGCRLIHEYGFRYRVVSQPIYRDTFKNEEGRREYLRVKQRESRARRKGENPVPSQDVKNVDSQQLTIVDSQSVSTDVNQAEAEAYLKKKKKVKEVVPLSPEELAGTLPLIDGTNYEISKTQVAEWGDAYPAVDVRQALKEVKVWCKANPKELWTRDGIARALNGWLKREQNKQASRSMTGGKPNGRPTAQSKPEQNRAAFDQVRAELRGLDSRSTGGHREPDAGTDHPGVPAPDRTGVNRH